MYQRKELGAMNKDYALVHSGGDVGGMSAASVSL